MNINSKHLMLGAILVIILVIGFVIVNGNNSSIEEAANPKNAPSNENLDPLFTLQDLQGVEYSLRDYEGTPVLVHFMAVGCGGEYSKLNDNQLKQLKNICTNLCDEKKVTIFTVLVSTCETTDLFPLYDMYNITWILGNDYQDSKLDVIETYSAYEPSDGMVLMLDKDLEVKEVMKESINSDTVVSKVLHLEG
jgi:peroxiredoxin